MDQEEDATTNNNNAAAAPGPEKPPTNRHKCAACKYQRRRCADDCALFPHFPTERTKEFMAAHGVFGVKNMTNLLTQIPLHADRERAVESLVWEASSWAEDPVNGPLGLYRKLEREKKHLENQLLLAKRQAQAAATAITTTPYNYQPGTTSSSFGLMQLGEGNNINMEGLGSVVGRSTTGYWPDHGQGFYYGGGDGGAGTRGIMGSNHVVSAGHGGGANTVHDEQSSLLMENGGRRGDNYDYYCSSNNNLINGAVNNTNHNSYYYYNNLNLYGGYQQPQQQQQRLLFDQMVPQSNSQNCYGGVVPTMNLQPQVKPLMIGATSHHGNRGSQEMGQVMQYKDSGALSTEEGSKSSGVQDQ